MHNRVPFVVFFRAMPGRPLSSWVRFYSPEQIEGGFAEMDTRHVLSYEYPNAADIAAGTKDQATAELEGWGK